MASIELSPDASLAEALDSLYDAARYWHERNPSCEPRLDLGPRSFEILKHLAAREGIVDVGQVLDGYCHAAGVKRWTVGGVDRGGLPRG